MRIAQLGLLLCILLSACVAPAPSPWMDEVDSARRERGKNSLATEDGEDATESFVAPDPRLDPTGDPRRRVYLVSHGWHTGIVVRRADIPTGVWPESEDFPGAEYLEVGWGERDYYQTREPGVWLTFKAALWPTPSVLHIVSFSGPVSSYFQHSEVIELELTQSGIEHLSGFVHDSFDRDGAVRSGQLGRGLYGHSAFYPAREKFHLFNTCNVWTARVLRAAGLPFTPYSAITTDSVMSQARQFGKTIQRTIVSASFTRRFFGFRKLVGSRAGAVVREVRVLSVSLLRLRTFWIAAVATATP
jgi:uncharacterized protein (TIGR02117 family)